MSIRLTAALLTVLLATAASPGQTPLGSAFTYQGRLNQAGQPFNGPADLLFELYDADVGGNLLGSQALDDVVVSDGLFTVALNAGGQFGASAFNGEQRWLRISVNGTPLSPRQELTAAPYALFSAGPWQTNGANLSYTAGNVGIGTSNPTSRLSVQNGGLLVYDSASQGIFLNTDSFGLATAFNEDPVYQYDFSNDRHTWWTAGSEHMVLNSLGRVGIGTTSPVERLHVAGGLRVDGGFTLSTGAASGRVLQSDANGVGTWQTDGLALPFSGSVASGVAFSINSTSTSDVANLTINNAASAAECVDASSNGSGSVIEASMTGTGRAGFFQIANAANGTDAVFATSSGSGRSITATMSGTGTAGSFSNTVGTNANPALSVSSAGNATGNSGTLDCVNTNTSAGRAAYFENNSTGFYTIRVNNTTEALAGQFVGNVSVIGDLSASGVKPFRIDHPDDPANKYLLHYAAESPEVINFYSETVTLDERGEAVVELPHYFAKINTRPRYQLTAVGAPMPMLHVALKISEAALSAGAKAEPGEVAAICSFRIAGGAPGGEVSWRVEALRNDRWVQQRGAPVEVEKEGLEKGTYQHPELYGQPPEMGMDYEAERERQSLPPLPDQEASASDVPGRDE